MGDDQKLLTEIYREVGETKATMKSVEKRVEDHIGFSSEEFKKIHELDTEQNRILDKHIEGVNTLKEMYIAHRVETIEQIQLLKDSLKVQRDEASARIEALEKPYDLLKFAGKVVVAVGAVAGAIVAIAQLLGML